MSPIYENLWHDSDSATNKAKVNNFPLIGNLRCYDGNCNENVTLKLNFALSPVFCDYSMLIALYKIGELHFRLLGTNGFHVKAKSERSSAASLRCRQNLKYEISRRRLADSVKTLQQKACLTCSTIIFLHSTNQIIDLWRCRREILKSLMGFEPVT